MKSIAQKLIAGFIFLTVSVFSAQAYVVEYTWNDFDASIHDGASVDQFVTNQYNGVNYANCHGYAFWQSYGRPFPSAAWALVSEVNTLITNGELVHLGTTPNVNATHVLYYHHIPGTRFNPLTATLIHSTIVSQFDSFPFEGQDFVQGKNGMTPGVSLHKVAKYDPTTIAHYFTYTPNSGSLIPLDYQPANPPSVLTCSAVIVNPITCHNGTDGSVGVLHSTDAASTQSYSWSGGGTTSTITNLSSGTYTVTITESPTNEICISSVTLVNPTLNVASVTTTNHDGSLCTLSPWGWVYGTGSATVNLANVGTYSYLWNVHNLTSQTAPGLCSGTYNVIVTNTGTGCVESYNCIVANGARLSGVDVNLYPNPNKGEFTIEVEELESASVIVSDASGKIVVQQELFERINNIDISQFGFGVYIVELTNKNQVITKRIIVE